MYHTYLHTTQRATLLPISTGLLPKIQPISRELERPPVWKLMGCFGVIVILKSRLEGKRIIGDCAVHSLLRLEGRRCRQLPAVSLLPANLQCPSMTIHGFVDSECCDSLRLSNAANQCTYPANTKDLLKRSRYGYVDEHWLRHPHMG